MGNFTVSLDFELGWGAIETGLWRMREDKDVYSKLRPTLKRIANLLDELEISLTWATVGAMISAPSQEDFDYLPLPFQSRAKEFLASAASTSKDGRDLFDLVASTSTPQDIGSHSFSHTRFQEKTFTEAQKAIEMQKSIAALNAFGITPQSFVFPVNQVASYNVVEQAGIKVARTPPKTPDGKVGKLVEKICGYTPTAIRTNHHGGLNVESGSMLYYWGLNSDWRLRRTLVQNQVRAGLKAATDSDHHLHLWLHPFNLVEIPTLEQEFCKLLKKAAKLRDADKLRIKPMSPVPS